MSILQSALAAGPALLALGFGLVLGVFCFGGLWWTVTLGMRSNNPPLWLVLSSIGRLGAVFAGVYFIARDSLTNAVLCLVGLGIARMVVVHYLRVAR